jgi:hypothetical protein
MEKEKDKIYNKKKTEKFIKKINVINNSKIRRFSNNLREKLNISDYVFGTYYKVLHYIFMILITVIVIFSNNITYLVIIVNLLLIDTFSIVVFNDCPLSILEKKYLGVSDVENRLYYMKNSNIMYTNNKVYDSTLDNLINAWSLVAIKILLLIFLNVFSIKSG